MPPEEQPAGRHGEIVSRIQRQQRMQIHLVRRAGGGNEPEVPSSGEQRIESPEAVVVSIPITTRDIGPKAEPRPPRRGLDAVTGV